MFKSFGVGNSRKRELFGFTFLSIFSLFTTEVSAQGMDWVAQRQGEIDNLFHHISHGPEKYYSGPSGTNNGFGRLFPPMIDRSLTRSKMRRLSNAMREPFVKYDRPHQLSDTPAGYTFLGQFIDHDITLDNKSMLTRVLPDGDLKNTRTVDLDLDSVYAGGPDETPFLYNLPYMRVGKRILGKGRGTRYDLLRTSRSRKYGPQGGEARALIGDPRNDENFVIAQLHAAFIAFHNRLTDILIERHYGDLRHRFCTRTPDCGTRILAGRLTRKAQKKIFEKAREHVIHYYHRIIAEDFLPRVIGEHRTRDILVNGRRFFFPHGFRKHRGSLEKPFIPLEFSTAAFRFGHSQVSDGYVIREGVFSRILDISVQAHKPLTRRNIVDWKYFFPIEKRMRGINLARKIDTRIAKSLFDLGGSDVLRGRRVNSLPMRNFLRSRVLKIPSGQYVAERILPEISSGNRYRRYNAITRVSSSRRIRSILRHSDTPLWFYILQEAELHGKHWLSRPGRYKHGRHHDGGPYRLGHTLGPVGGTIVGEVLIGLLEHYDRKTGKKGLKYRPEIKAGIDSDRYTPLTLTYLRRGHLSKKRYMMRNLLIDAGLGRLVRYERY